jgi:hypothetical protein
LSCWRAVARSECPRAAPRRGQPPPRRPPKGDHAGACKTSRASSGKEPAKQERVPEASKLPLNHSKEVSNSPRDTRLRRPPYSRIAYNSDLKRGTVRNPPTRFRSAPASSFKVAVLSAILISSWWRSGFLCCWRVVAHSECARATPRRGQPPSRRPPNINHARAWQEHQASLEKEPAELERVSRSEQSYL